LIVAVSANTGWVFLLPEVGDDVGLRVAYSKPPLIVGDLMVGVVGFEPTTT
jgi:hypothetical protein